MTRRILNLDLDFFVNPILYHRSDDARPEDEGLEVEREEDVRQFLENQCLLRVGGNTPGIVVTEHGEVMDHWRVWMERGDLRCPFSVTHVDAHHDLGSGFGDAIAIVEVCNRVITLPVEERQARAWEHLNSGSYLSYALAYRWLETVTFVMHPENDNVIPDPILTSDRTAIQLSPIELREPMDGFRSASQLEATDEPRIEYEVIARRKYVSPHTFDAVFVSRSPGFVPLHGDHLVEIVQKYMRTP